MSSRGRSTLAGIAYTLLVLLLTLVVGLSCAGILAQAVRTAPNRSWTKNFNAAVIGAAYAIVLLVSVAYCLKRRIAVHRRLQRISKSYHTLGKGDLPKAVDRYVKQEYARACLVVYETQPKDGHQEGWNKPSSPNGHIRFRTTLLNTIREIDDLAHEVIPRHPMLRPHARMLHHFRFILPLLPRDDDGLTSLHYYDSAIQLVRHASREPSESEYILGLSAANGLKKALNECRLAMAEGSLTDLRGLHYLGRT